MRNWLLVVALVAMPVAALAEEVYYCTDAKAAGIKWDKQNPDGRVGTFEEDRYVMKIVSKTRRRMTRTTGDTKGSTHHLTCHEVLGQPPLLSCTGEILKTWAFQGNRYTRSYLFGPNLGGDPNIWLAYGTCVKY